MSTFATILAAVQSNTGRSDTATSTMIYNNYCTVIELLDRAQEWDEHDHTKSKNTVVGVDALNLATFTDDGGAPKYIRNIRLDAFTYGSTLTSGTALVVGTHYEIVTRTTLDFTTSNFVLTSGKGNAAGSTYVCVVASTLGTSDQVKAITGITSYNPLIGYSKKKWDETQTPGIVPGGRPRAYCYYNKMLYLDRSPDAIYKLYIRYQDRPSKPTSVSDTTHVCPFTDMDSVLVAMTTALVWGSLEEKDNMAMWTNISKSLLSGMSAEAQRILDLSPAVGAKVASQQSTSGTYWLDPFQGRR